MEMVRDPSTTEKLTKLDAARRQLRVAIRLFFEDRDMVSIHTLTAAAQELLRGLLKSEGGGSFIKDSDLIRPERRKEYLSILHEPQNFFKHADRDPDEVLDFNPESTVFCLVDCVDMDRRLTHRVLREGLVFMVWFSLLYPALLLPGSFTDTILELRKRISNPTDKALFRLMLDLDLPNTE